MATKNLLLLVSGLAVLFLGVPAQVSAPPIDSRRGKHAPQCLQAVDSGLFFI